MSLLRPPFRILKLETSLSPAALIERLGADLDVDGGAFGPSPGTRPWIGVVKAEGMEMRRRTPFRNSFLPMVRAQFLPGEHGTQLRISMTLMLMTRLLLGVWTLLATVAVVGYFATGNFVLWAVPVMCAAGFLMATVAFNLEANQAEAYLKERVGHRAR